MDENQLNVILPIIARYKSLTVQLSDLIFELVLYLIFWNAFYFS